MLYCGRLAEVIKSGTRFDPGILEVTDEGGITHSYPITSTDDIELLGRSGECVLDDLDRAAGAPRTDEERRKRVAEQWLADPRTGDLFALPDGSYLELVEVGEAGSIWAAIGNPLSLRGRDLVVTGVSFTGARTLRHHLALKTRPIYKCSALSTMRAAFANHALINHHTDSPLWTGATPSEQIGKGKQVKRYQM